MRKHMGLLLLATVVIGILVLYWVTFTVRFREKVLVTTFGKITSVAEEPGLKLKWPWQRTINLDGRIRTYQPTAYEIQTQDKRNIIVTLFVNWRINDAKVFYNRFAQSGGSSSMELVMEAERTINGWLGEARGVFAEYDMSELVTLDPSQFKLDQLERGQQGEGGILAKVRDLAGSDDAVEIVDLGIRKLGVPDSVSEAVFDRMKEERGAEEQRLLAEGQSQADAILGRAQGLATEIRARAEAQARAIEGEGDATAAQYYAEYLENPALANFLRRLQTLRRTLSERTTLILDRDSPPFELLSEQPLVVPSADGAGKDKD